MSTKPRSDAVLLNLPEVDKTKLREALLAGMSYNDACAFTQKEIGVKTNTEAMGNFYHKECLPYMLLRRQDDVETARVLAEQGDQSPGRFSEATKNAIQQRVFNLSKNPESKPIDIAMLNELLLKDRAINIEDRAIALKERSVAVQEKRLAIQQRAADVKAEDYAAEQAVKLETLALENQNKRAQDALDIRFGEYHREVEVWKKAESAGQNPGPRPEWDRTGEVIMIKAALLREKERLTALNSAKEG